MNLDRIKQPAAAFILSQFPREMYARTWSGRVVAQGGSNAFDFQPDDPRIPGHSGIPLKLPFPGFSLQLDPTQSPRAELGWANGDPSMPELRLWESPGLAQLTVQASQSVSLSAPSVNLGQLATQPLVLGTVFVAALTVVMTAIAAAFTAGAAAWTAAGVALPLLSPAAAIATPVYTAAATAITSFLSALSQSLSTVSKTA